MSSPFPAFEKIAESIADWDLSESARRALDREEWIVTEKIHGANFSWISDGATLRCAKRKARLEGGESFFGHERLQARLQGALLSCAARVLTGVEGGVEVWIRGELFGGAYPHQEVPPQAECQAVQTGVWYSPRIEFCVFDIEWVDTEGHRKYFSFDEAREHAEFSGLIFTQPLFRGSLTKALNYSPIFQSNIPSLFDLPEIKGNFAEGVVIKTNQPILIETKKGSKRPLVKIKHPQFNEDQRFHQAKKPLQPKNKHLDSYALNLLEWAAMSLINKNRIESAISKVGSGTSELWKQIITKFVVYDIWEIFDADYSKELLSLDDEELILLKKVISDEINQLL